MINQIKNLSTGRILFQFIVLIGILASTSPLFAKTITIQYQFAGAKEMKLYWGINDWHRINPLPAKTIITNQVMETAMEQKNGIFYCLIDVPDDAVINAAFGFEKRLAWVGPTAFYVDDNQHQNYLFKASENNFFSIQSDTKKLQPKNNISLLKYGGFLITLLGILTLLLIAVDYKKNKSWSLFNPKNYGVAVLSVWLLLCLLMMRLQTAQIQYSLLSDPIHYFVAASKAFIPDFQYACFIVFIVGIASWLLPKKQQSIRIVFLSIAILSILIAIINIAVVQVLGNPFNYPWLYYSDFLKGTDAKLAMGANINLALVLGIILLFLACYCLLFLIQFFYARIPLILFTLLMLIITPGYLLQTSYTLSAAKRVNPIVHFISSTSLGNIFQKENRAAISDMATKNVDTSSVYYTKLFKNSPIKNILLIVLESTPAEYVSVYDTSLSTTPFLKSMQLNSLVFNSIYAHVPATNKSMVGLLTATNPYVSFKSLTVEKPNINLLSISDILKKEGYATGFFSAGDNEFQNAAGFLKNHSFDIIQDFHSNPITKTSLSDSRFSKNQGDGMADSVLYHQFTQWHSSNLSKPFFGMLWTFQTHYPYYNLGRTKNYGTGNINLERYLNSLSQADELIGKLYAYLKKLHLAESTLMVIVGDHGEAFGRHQQTTHASGIYEENLHVPLLFINPILFKGEQNNVIGGLSDIAPTLLAVLNKPIPTDWQGENLWSNNRRKRVYFFSPFSDFLVGFREGNTKFIYNTSTNTASLYDLTTDPHEMNNIADAHKGFVDSAKIAVDAWVAYQNTFMNKLLK